MRYRLTAMVVAVIWLGLGLSAAEPKVVWKAVDLSAKGTPGSVIETDTGWRLQTPRRSASLGAVACEAALPKGVHLLTVEARGAGDLVTRADGTERRQPLGGDWAEYGFLFESGGQPVKLLVGVASDIVQQPNAELRGIRLVPPTPAQTAAWNEQEDSYRQFGFRVVDAQPPTPGVKAPKPTAVRRLAAMKDRVVFLDERIDYAHTQRVPRLVDWLCANGLRQLDADELSDWMKGYLAEGADAYGSVVCMSMGMTPGSILETIDDLPLWFRYLQAGGRIVYVGDLPFYNRQSETVEPVSGYTYGPRPLGMRFGWNSPYWGQQLPTRPTALGKAWGFETHDGSITGFALPSVSIAFDVYDVPAEPDVPGAGRWFKNVRPDLPWSGVIKLCQQFSGSNDAQLRDVWRAIHYVGRPVEIPPMLAPWSEAPPPLSVSLSASGIRERTQFARGERIEWTATTTREPTGPVTVELSRGDAVVVSAEGEWQQAGKTWQAGGAFPSAPWAYGDYTLTATSGDLKESVETGIRYVKPISFSWGFWVGEATTAARRDMIEQAIAQLGMEPCLASHSVGLMDAVLRVNNGFNLRLDKNLEIPKTDTPEVYYRLDADWQPHADRAYGGGRPMQGFTHPDVEAATRQMIADWYRPLATHPALRPRIECNDDFSIRYGFDYAPQVRERFKQVTGREAPGPLKGKDARQELTLPKPGIVPDDEPWLQWCLFTLEHVSGRFNKLQTEAVTSVRPDTRIGPIPGGMQIPLVQMWEASQYPPLNFGAKGFNLGYCYYYNSYWQPVLTNTYWLETTRMGNRGLEVWLLADCMGNRLYHRNNLYHLLQGGVKGLPYFTWGQRSAGAWEEIKHQAPAVERIAPVQWLLQPARRRLGLLLPVTADCYSPADHLIQPYAYANLMQGHFDVEPVAEEEILAGRAARYEAVALYYVRWLPASVARALETYAANGGKLLLDPTIPFDIPGAIRLPVDLGMGQQHTEGIPKGQAHLSVPGIRDYGDPRRIATIAEAVGQEIAPLLDCPDPTLTANTFQIGTTPYIWFVNAQSGEEYRFLRPLGTTDAGAAKIQPWADEVAASRFAAPVRIPGMSGVPYDLIAGKRLDTADDGTFWVSTERLGGSLVAFYPEPVAGINLRQPGQAKRGDTVTIAVDVRGDTGLVPGAVPIHLRIADPAGNELPLSGFYATVDGTFEITWAVASNDPIGAWRVTAEELASHQRVELPVTVSE